MTAKISKEEVRHVADLARLDLNERDQDHFTGQLNTILSYMEKLGELDTRDIEPTTHAIQLHNVFRADEVGTSLGREKVLENAPESDGASFVVPKVI